MKLDALLRFGIVTALLLIVVLPLTAWKNASSVSNEKAESSWSASAANAMSPSDDIPSDLTPAILSATYSGHSGCAATEHNFDIVVDVLDAGNNIYRVRNLLDEGEVIKARLRDGKLQLGSQKMGSYQVTGYVQYMESPARMEAHVKYEDGIGYCEDVSVFTKR
jgi:hypothetical protein